MEIYRLTIIKTRGTKHNKANKKPRSCAHNYQGYKYWIYLDNWILNSAVVCLSAENKWKHGIWNGVSWCHFGLFMCTEFEQVGCRRLSVKSWPSKDCFALKLLLCVFMKWSARVGRSKDDCIILSIDSLRWRRWIWNLNSNFMNMPSSTCFQLSPAQESSFDGWLTRTAQPWN